ncbi:hypothetical protein [Paenibacillus sp. UNC451MF]|uniref:hypothetical protein n=1 Tax=Paenibacillus sp. UNC451MF TaxID=1449063 RepID=UPI00048BC1E7|nr:hypothetical protein [Paenibacillus sp. UNC451MF]
MLKRELTRFIFKYVLGYAFQPARRNRRGEIVLAKGKLINWIVYIAFLIAVMAFVLFYMNEEDSDEWIYNLVNLGAASIFLGVCSFMLALSKTVVNEQTVTAHRWYGKKSISFSDVHTISFTRFFGGCFVLKGEKKTVWVPLENVGSAEFVELLCKRLGTERCTVAVEALNNRRKQLSQLFQG